MHSGPKILVIDDEESMRIGCDQVLSEEGYAVKSAEDGRRGLMMAREESFDAIILDLKMPGLDGMAVLEKLREDDPNAVVIVITGYPTIESAVEAMKRGAYDFLPKPFTPEALLAVVKRSVDRRQLAMENICLRTELQARTGQDLIMGKSPSMIKVADQVRKVAHTDSTVLICGETGVGKELLAKAIHDQSGRREKPFVVVDCGALVETLFESELFGHVKGAFTGATETKYGKFELANGGTIFLDEIGNVGINIQAKLLRVIQEREIVKVGGSQKIGVEVRIIAATNKDLLEEMRQGRFREDLFYRLSVVPIHVPPLRERGEDIPLLAEYFLQKFCQKRKRNLRGISDEALQSLKSYGWPGNVREMENAIERAVIMTEGDVIQPGDLLYYSPSSRITPQPAPEGRLAEIEKEEITRALKRFNWQKNLTAAHLGINRKTLREKIRKHGIQERP